MMGVWYAVALHLVWAALLLFSSAAQHATAVSAVSRLFPNRYGLAIILLTVAGCATIGIYLKKLSMTKIMMLVPQQLILGISAAGVLRAMYLSHFADGVQRPRDFLIADQLPAVLALLVHSATILYLTYLIWERDAA